MTRGEITTKCNRKFLLYQPTDVSYLHWKFSASLGGEIDWSRGTLHISVQVCIVRRHRPAARWYTFDDAVVRTVQAVWIVLFICMMFGVRLLAPFLLFSYCFETGSGSPVSLMWYLLARGVHPLLSASTCGIGFKSPDCRPGRSGEKGCLTRTPGRRRTRRQLVAVIDC